MPQRALPALFPQGALLHTVLELQPDLVRTAAKSSFGNPELIGHALMVLYLLVPFVQVVIEN